MIHGDDNGIILPPKVASAHVVFIPIIRKQAERSQVMEYIEGLAKALKEKTYGDRKLRVEIDDRDIGGARGWDWIKKGIPLRVEVGPRDMADSSVFVGRRDKDSKEKESVKKDRFVAEITQILDEIQKNLYERALSFREKHTKTIDENKKFYEFFTPQDKEKPGQQLPFI